MALRRSEIEELKEQLEQLKEKFAQINDTVIENANDMEEDVEREARRMFSKWKEKTQDTYDGVKDKTQAAWGKAKDTGRSVQDYTQDNPWQALAIAALAGVVIGSLMRRDRD